MTDRDFLLIAFQHFLDNENQESILQEIFEDVGDDDYLLYTNKLLGFPKYFDYTPPQGGVYVFKLWPHIFNRIHVLTPEGFIDSEIEDAERVDKKGKLEIEQLQSIIDTNKSVVKTNESVVNLNNTVIPDSYEYQRKFGIGRCGWH
jgi:hypothetical protein